MRPPPPHVSFSSGGILTRPYIRKILAETDTSITFEGHFYKAEWDGFLPRLYLVEWVSWERIPDSDSYQASFQKAALVQLLTYTQHKDTSEYFSDEEEFGPGKVCLTPTYVQTVTWHVIRDLPTKADRDQVYAELRAKYD